MTLSGMILRGLRHNWRSHLGASLACAAGAAALSGALLVGDSVRGTLRSFAAERLGDVRLAMDTGGRYVAESMARDIEDRLAARSAPVLAAPGMAIAEGAGGGARRQVNGVRVLGVDGRFWDLAPKGAATPSLAGGDAAVSEALAAALGVVPGEEIVLRVGAPALLARDAPLSARGDLPTRSAAMRVRAVVADAALGRFSLESGQVPPKNVFVPLAALQDLLGLDGQVNRILLAEGQAGPLTIDEADRALSEAFTLRSVGIGVRTAGGAHLVESDRIFLEPALGAAAMALPGAVGSLVYLANEIRAAGDPARRTPYSFVLAASPSADPRTGPVRPGMRNDEVLVNRWLADRLRLSPGEPVMVSYFRLLPDGRYEEASESFTVRSVLEMDRIAPERERVPAFPGLTDVDRCRDWDVGMPLDEGRLADKDNEAYWLAWRQTPKAVFTLEAGRRMWGSRFGDLTGVRYPIDVASAAEIQRTLDAVVDPADLGLAFTPVREEAARAVEQAVDFGGLFLGMSIFIIAAALLLTGLVFGFGVERRSGEVGTLLALGFTPSRIRMLFLGEGLLSAAAGSVLGSAAGILYTRALIRALGSAWAGAVAGARIRFAAPPGTLALAAAASALLAIAAMAVVLLRLSGRSVPELVAADPSGADAAPKTARNWPLVLGLVGFAAACALALRSATLGGDPSGAFFGAGSALLVFALVLAFWGFSALGGRSPRNLTLCSVGVRNAARRRGRSLAVVGLLAAGCFIVVSVAAMGQDPSRDRSRSSGTGGFALWAESTLPVVDDLRSTEGRRRAGMRDGDLPEGTSFVPVKVGPGDDASCLNLNRAQSPRILGIDPHELASRGAFVRPGRADPWELLEQDLPGGVVPGLAGDLDTATWNLGVRTGAADGHEILYRDERGEAFRVRLVGALPMRKSLFQGAVLVSNRHFTDRYPSEEGWRAFLVESPAGSVAAGALEGRLFRLGMSVLPAADRLAAFLTVENTYLRMFNVLGGLGLMLGTVGMALVVLRNVLDRRSELALMAALGYSRGALVWMVLAEHLFLFGVGMAAGSACAGVAVAPALGGSAPALPLFRVLAAIAVSGLCWTSAAAALAFRGPLLPALREE